MLTQRPSKEALQSFSARDLSLPKSVGHSMIDTLLEKNLTFEI